jgi:hypothetical protein
VLDKVKTDVTCGAETAYHSGAHSSPLVFNLVRVALALVFCVVFCRSLLFLLSIFLSPLYCLSFDLWLLPTPLLSSDFSSYVCHLSMKKCQSYPFLTGFTRGTMNIANNIQLIIDLQVPAIRSKFKNIFHNTRFKTV